MSSSVDKIMEKQKEDNMKSIIESLLPQIRPYVSPMIEGVEEAFGDNAYLCVMKREKDGKCYIHVIETPNIESFKVSEIKSTVKFEDFLELLLSGEIKDMFDKKD